jgi:hypothetical protein
VGKLRREILESDLIKHWLIRGMTHDLNLITLTCQPAPCRRNPRKTQPNRFQFDIIWVPGGAKPFDYKLIKQIAN